MRLAISRTLLRFPLQFFILLQSVAIDKFTNLTYGSFYSLEALPDLYFFICYNLLRLTNLVSHVKKLDLTYGLFTSPKA